MAQFTFTNNTYAGEALAGFMASTLLEADSVKRGLLTVINDVKGTQSNTRCRRRCGTARPIRPVYRSGHYRPSKPKATLTR
jgi:hypothetical protein